MLKTYEEGRPCRVQPESSISANVVPQGFIRRPDKALIWSTTDMSRPRGCDRTPELPRAKMAHCALALVRSVLESGSPRTLVKAPE